MDLFYDLWSDDQMERLYNSSPDIKKYLNDIRSEDNVPHNFKIILNSADHSVVCGRIDVPLAGFSKSEIDLGVRPLASTGSSLLVITAKKNKDRVSDIDSNIKKLVSNVKNTHVKLISSDFKIDDEIELTIPIDGSLNAENAFTEYKNGVLSILIPPTVNKKSNKSIQINGLD